MTSPRTPRKLTLDDIADLRQYERERADFRTSIIALKKRRRVGVGPFITVLFENRQTIRFQIQEMARAEKIFTDEGIETELRMYNPLIPDPGQLAITLFVELTNDADLRTWLPKLVGIERCFALIVGSENPVEVRATVDADHESQLTRDEITASVHYLHWSVPADVVAAIDSGAPVVLRCDHPEYLHDADLSAETVAELLDDLRDD